MHRVMVLMKAILAGWIGTVVLTLSETVEMKLTGREASTVPGQVGSKLFGIQTKNQEALHRLNTQVHWGHGVLMGSLRGVLCLFGLSRLGATGIHYALVWGGDALLYAALGIAPLPWKWKRQELVTDMFHKGMYALATGIAFDLLTASERQKD